MQFISVYGAPRRARINGAGGDCYSEALLLPLPCAQDYAQHLDSLLGADGMPFEGHCTNV
jgi:hypothetical protein